MGTTETCDWWAQGPLAMGLSEAVMSRGQKKPGRSVLQNQVTLTVLLTLGAGWLAMESRRFGAGVRSPGAATHGAIVWRRLRRLPHAVDGQAAPPAPGIRSSGGMTSQTPSAVPRSSSVWPGHTGEAVAHDSCATRFSLARGATGAAPCKALEGGCVGGPRADRGSCAPPAGAVAPHPLLPGLAASRGFLPPRATELHTTYLRPAPCAPAGTRWKVLAARATQITSPAWEAGVQGGENR
jgi:hypothetical protein